MNKSIVACVLAQFFLLCGSTKSNESELETLQFTVVDSLLQSPVADTNLKISFRPPKLWTTSVGDTIVRSITKLASLNGGAPVKPIMYREGASQSYFVLNEARFFDAKNGDSSLQNIAVQCKKRFPRCETKTARFIKEPFVVHQIIVNMGTIVLCSMFFTAFDSPSFQASFFLPFDSFSEHMKIVESVIGSIGKIEKPVR